MPGQLNILAGFCAANEIEQLPFCLRDGYPHRVTYWTI